MSNNNFCKVFEINRFRVNHQVLVKIVFGGEKHMIEATTRLKGENYERGKRYFAENEELLQEHFKNFSQRDAEIFLNEALSYQG